MHTGLPWKVKTVDWHVPTPLPMLLHLCSGYTGRKHSQNSRAFLHNNAMPAMSSADAAIDAARHLTDALANPTPAAPFACFGAQTMYAIWQSVDIFLATGAPTPNPIPNTHLHNYTATHAEGQLWPPRISKSAARSTTRISNNKTHCATTKGRSTNNEPTLQVPPELTHPVKPYNWVPRGWRLRLPRGAWPHHKENTGVHAANMRPR